MSAAGSGRAWVVIVTGEPGSGKTSLGRLLAAALRVPFLSRDDVRGGMLATAGLWTGEMREPPARESAVDAFVAVIETMAGLGITAVLEFVVTPDRTAAFDRLQAAVNCMVIVTTCAAAADRSVERDRTDPLLNRPDVLAALGHETIDSYLRAPERDRVRTTMRTDFDLPTLLVETDRGYEPAIETIVEWVIGRTRAG